MASTTTCPWHTLTPGRTHSHSVHTLYNSGYCAVTICCSVISELQFGFAVSLVSAAAANKIHIGAAAPILMALFITTRVPSVVNQAGREKGEGGTQKRETIPSSPPPRAGFVIKENPSVISPPSQCRSKPHGRAIERSNVLRPRPPPAL